jgi:fructose-bisphosphate aldolase/2-amino-3,7-dideoxy-D-threo-hept-6-ulosonate synthase
MAKNSLFSKSGKSVVVAFDHGIAALEYKTNPRTAVEKFIGTKPDGILMSPPLIKLCADLFAKYPEVVPVASVVTIYPIPNFSVPVQVFDFDFAIDMGARGIKNLLILGQADGRDMTENMKNTCYLASRARQKGIPFMVEAVAWGPLVPPDRQNDPEIIGKACRMAFECGADIIKTNYTGDTKSFKEIVDSVPVPVIVLGGAKGELKGIFQGVRDAMDSGAKGVAFGRNVFQHENPPMMVNALKELVYNGAGVDETLAKMK